MDVSLISISNGPSLALRNIKRYCMAHADIRDQHVSFDLSDYNIEEFRKARVQSAQQWTYITKFDQVLVELTRQNPPDVIAFSCYLWNIQLSLHFAHLFKLLLPNTLIVFGGPDAGPRAQQLLEQYSQVDFVIEGDGEIPFLALIRELLNDCSDYSKVSALRYRSDQQIVSNPISSEQVDMALLEGVYEEVPAAEEVSQWPWPNLLYETLRGCPYACSYCMYGKTKMNAKPIVLVVEEMLALLQQGLTVEIIDPTFTTYQKRAKQILRDLGQQQYSGRLHFEAYPDSIDEEMAELMVGAKVAAVGIGFQTVSSQGLKAVKRPKNLVRFERAIALLKTFKIHYYVDIIYGLPATSIEDFFSTVDYLYSHGVNRLMIYRLLGLPGSPMMADSSKYDLLFSESPPYELLSSNTYSLSDLVFCDQFQHAYEKLLGVIQTSELSLLVEAAGGVSQIVIELLDYGVDNAHEFKCYAINRWGQNCVVDHQILLHNL